MNNKLIYLDNAATTRTKKEVLDVMLPYFTDYYANPSAVYNFSSKVRNDITVAREVIADSLGASSREIYFTSGGTEADNWAVKSTALAYQEKGRHIITSKIEHPAVLNTCAYLEGQGFEITYLNVDSEGFVSLDELEKSIREDTVLITIMFANNEIGTIQNIKAIGEIATRHSVIFHTDAVQAYAHIPINVKELRIDLLSASAHKFGGPKGIGFLYIDSKLKVRSFINGGSQERKRRAGTENVPGIIGMAKAVSLSIGDMDKNFEYTSKLQSYLTKRLKSEIDGVHINGSLSKRLGGNINVHFENVSSELLLIMLDNKNICISAGSACASGSIDPSHVLIAIGLSSDAARESVRISLSEENTLEELDVLMEALKEIVPRVRGMA
jgi:hypothetical protein